MGKVNGENGWNFSPVCYLFLNKLNNIFGRPGKDASLKDCYNCLQFWAKCDTKEILREIDEYQQLYAMEEQHTPS
jgi:Zn-finger protein